MKTITKENYRLYYEEAVAHIGLVNLSDVRHRIKESINKFREEHASLTSRYKTETKLNDLFKDLSTTESYELYLNLIESMIENGADLPKEDKEAFINTYKVYYDIRDAGIDLWKSADISPEVSINKSRNLILSNRDYFATLIGENSVLSEFLCYMVNGDVRANDLTEFLEDTEEETIDLAITMYGMAMKENEKVTEENCAFVAASMVYLSDSMKKGLNFATACRTVLEILVKFVPLAVLATIAILSFSILPVWLAILTVIFITQFLFEALPNWMEKGEAETEKDVVNFFLAIILNTKDFASDILHKTFSTIVDFLLAPVVFFCREFCKKTKNVNSIIYKKCKQFIEYVDERSRRFESDENNSEDEDVYECFSFDEEYDEDEDEDEDFVSNNKVYRPNTDLPF